MLIVVSRLLKLLLLQLLDILLTRWGESLLWEGVFLFSYSLGVEQDLIPFLVWEYCGNQQLRCMDLFRHSRLCVGGSLLFSLLIPLYHWLCCSQEG